MDVNRHPQKINYYLECEKEIKRNEGRLPKLLLHSCCAPCSSAVLEYLSPHFDITLFYFNPNITPEEEYRKRVAELHRLVREAPSPNPVRIVEGRYDTGEFFEMARGLEDLPEGGERCAKCYRLRLEETAKKAAAESYEYFTTTLSVSPYKNAQKLNSIGAELGERYGVKYLLSDFKKKNGYHRSIELSARYGLYRQNYCGCIFSARQSRAKIMDNRE
jgi:Uncharacterized protein conserved in bacteria